jgi:hypothetical protein
MVSYRESLKKLDGLSQEYHQRHCAAEDAAAPDPRILLGFDPLVVLEMDSVPNSTRAVDVAFKKLSMELHPDKQKAGRKRKIWEQEEGTSEEAFHTLKQAHDQLRVDGQLQLYIHELEAFTSSQQACAKDADEWDEAAPKPSKRPKPTVRYGRARQAKGANDAR